MEQYLIVTAPVADIRRKPVDAKPEYIHDDLQETQALYNELLLYRDETEDWYYAEAVEQRKRVGEGASRGYPGWVRRASVAPVDSPPEYNGVVKEKIAVVRKDPSDKGGALITLSIGTKLTIAESDHATHHRVLMADGKNGWVRKKDVNLLGSRPTESALRKSIMSAAKLFLGVPYLWGGRSMYMPELHHRTERIEQSAGPEVKRFGTQHPTLSTAVLTGVDCSGLTNLVFRVNWIDIPRDADDQWLAATKISRDRLKPGDLIFASAKGEPGSVAHVLLSAGGEDFFEAEETGKVVSLTGFSDKFGLSLERLAQQGFKAKGGAITFGSMIPRDE